MNTTNYIFISGSTKDKVSSALQELADLYADTPYTQDIVLYEAINVKGQFVISFTIIPDFERFKYFVNFLNYPIESESVGAVFGFWTIGEFDKLPEKIIGKRALLYVSESDTEGDNVHAVYSGATSTLKLGFAFREGYKELDVLELEFTEPQLDSNEFNVVDKINGTPKAEKPNVGCAGVLALFIVISFGLYLM
jgi:hypothetical protein